MSQPYFPLVAGRAHNTFPWPLPQKLTERYLFKLSSASFRNTNLTVSNSSTFQLCRKKLCTLEHGFHSWEYPNKQGVGCNAISPDDSANFLLFLQALRATPAGSKIILSAAVGITPFNGPDSTPMTDVSGFATVFDYIGKITSFLAKKPRFSLSFYY